MTRNALILIAAVGLAAAILILWRGSAATETAAQDQAVIALGQRLYTDNCASCHGAQGQGDGPLQLVSAAVASAEIAATREVQPLERVAASGETERMQRSFWRKVGKSLDFIGI